MKNMVWLLTVACWLTMGACSSDSVDEEGAQPGEELVPAPEINQKEILSHPRLLFTAAEEEKLRALLERDSLAQQLRDQVIKSAVRLCSMPPVPYRKDGRGTMLSVSREYVKRLITLSLAYRLSGQQRYVNEVKSLLVYVCNFPDWNQSHYLDTAEMTTAVAIAYDWLYEVLPLEVKAKVSTCITTRALNVALKEYETGKESSWAKRETNWNVVCNTGMVLGALATAENNVVSAETIINNAVRYVPNCLQYFAPDGVCYEGPSYWEYTNDYLALLLKTLYDNFQTDYGISALPGVRKTAQYYVQTLSPTGTLFNFADSGSTNSSVSPVFLLFSRLFGQPEVADWYRGQVEKTLKKSYIGNRFFSLALPWLVGIPSAENMMEKPRLQTFHGLNDILVFNGSRQVPHSIYLIAKGADPDRAHQQLDGGSFVLDTDGIRWMVDLGSENYALPGFWEYYGRRWDYFLNTNLSHNTINIDGKLQNPRGTAHLIDENQSVEQPYAVLDMSTLYVDQASRVTRKFQWMDDTTIEITDDVTLKEASSTLQWLAATYAKVRIEGRKAILMQDGQRLTLEVLSPQGASWSTHPAQPNSNQEKPLPGVKMVACKCMPPSTQVSLKIRIHAGE